MPIRDQPNKWWTNESIVEGSRTDGITVGVPWGGADFDLRSPHHTASTAALEVLAVLAIFTFWTLSYYLTTSKAGCKQRKACWSWGMSWWIKRQCVPNEMDGVFVFEKFPEAQYDGPHEVSIQFLYSISSCVEFHCRWALVGLRDHVRRSIGVNHPRLQGWDLPIHEELTPLINQFGYRYPKQVLTRTYQSLQFLHSYKSHYVWPTCELESLMIISHELFINH